MNPPSALAQKDRNFAVPAMAKRRGFCRRLLLLSVFLLSVVIRKLTTALRRCLPRLADTGAAAIVKDRRTTVRAPVVVVVVMAVFWVLFFLLVGEVVAYFFYSFLGISRHQYLTDAY